MRTISRVLVVVGLSVAGMMRSDVAVTAQQPVLPREAFVAQERASQAPVYLGQTYELYGADSTYLGNLSCLYCVEFGSSSVNNQFGTYGSSFSSNSIRNRFGMWGTRFGSYSACDRFALQPPRVYLRGQYQGTLTVNRFNAGFIPGFYAWLASDVCGYEFSLSTTLWSPDGPASSRVVSITHQLSSMS